MSRSLKRAGAAVAGVCACLWMAAPSACSSRVRQQASPAASAVPPATASQDGGKPPIDSGVGVLAGNTFQHDLIVGSERGLEAWKPDGSGSRLISAGQAQSPRWADESSVIVIVSRDSGYSRNLARGATLERVSLLDGKRTHVATLPPFACKHSASPNPDEEPPKVDLAIQDPNDFIVMARGRRACMNLMDRNENMASIAVDVALDLVSGKVRRALSMGQDACTPPASVKVAAADTPPKCVADRSPAPDASRRAAYPFDFTSAGILKQKGAPGARVLKIRGWIEEFGGLSPSGRWTVLRGDQEDGDYIHASVVLLDRQSGEVFPIREGRSWPEPLHPSGKQKLPEITTPIDHTFPVVGETDIRWLGTSAESELLVVEDLVVRPGHYSFAVKGEVAR